MKDETRKVLIDAADLLERDGWVQGGFYCSGTGRHCLLGAIKRVAGLNPEHDDLNGVARDAVEAVEYHLRWDAATWNDRREREADEVVSMLHAVATAANDKESP